MIDKPVAEHIAAIVHAIRDDWGLPGIMTALAKLRERPVSEVTIAAILAAGTPSNRTPEIIAMAGEHCRDVRQAIQSEAARHTSSVKFGELCDHCGRAEPHCQSRITQAEDPHQFTTPAIRRAVEQRQRKSTAAKPGYMPEWFREQAAMDIETGKKVIASIVAESMLREARASVALDGETYAVDGPVYVEGDQP